MSQPTNYELNKALNAVARGEPGAVERLVALRQARTTWEGDKEQQLRRSLDAALTQAQGRVVP